MKKMTILLWGGLFALISCSDSIYEEIDEQNNEMNAPPTFNNDAPGHAHGDSGDSGIVTYGSNYVSPWDLWYRVSDKQPSYLISNGNAEFNSPYNLRVRALVGLAYFDGNNDGIYDDLNTGASYNLALGNYPTLYANNQEVGNLVYNTNPFVVNAYPATGSSIRMEDGILHLADGSTPVYLPPNVSDIFLFQNLTGPERTLLYQYGKVFFYEVEVIDKFTGALVMTALMHPEIQTLPTGPFPNPDWKRVEDVLGNHLQGSVPGWTNLDLYFYNAGLPTGTIWNGPSGTGHICDSREVVFDVPHSLKLHEISIPGGSYKLSLSISQNNFWLWENSTLYLTVKL